MASYTVFLVDDEKNILQGLHLLIDWNALDCEIIGESVDGAQGAAMIQSLRPDIVITDICMTSMSGLEMVAQTANTDTRFIIISGYSDFNYAKSGIELGVIDYILKPIDEDELILAVQKAIRSIQLVRAQNAEQRRYESLCSAVNDLALRDFCNSYFDNEREALSLLDCMETVHIPQGYYTALYVELPNGSTPVEKIRETLVDVSRKLLCDNILHYKHTPTSFVLILITSTPPEKKLADSLKRFHAMLNAELSCTVTLGVGGTYHLIHQIPLSVQEATRSLVFTLLKGANSVNRYMDNLDHAHFVEVIPAKLWDVYKNALAQADIEAIINCSGSILQYAVSLQMPLVGLQILSINLLLLGFHALGDVFDYSKNNASTDCLGNIKFIYSVTQPRQIENITSSILKELYTEFLRINNLKAPAIIPRIQEYIKTHLSEDLSLNSVSQLFHISPTYMCRLFKKETGQLFTDYVTDFKIKESKKMLMNDFHVYEIAETLGYKDTKYFSRLFEKRTGQKPSEYKKSCLKNFKV
ncbi:response regulator [Lachnotalea sp. AF33-28]|uniref:response regulator n=1 Tax=Lachnotalea sp. AF33-28 TaxID=2292046 RepID=UPI000E50C6D6|nr:response regulator [Lachnotalea sp. AF33-28]RHP29079.1 response regulator [Lachnotalea sp. AF33-28]